MSWQEEIEKLEHQGKIRELKAHSRRLSILKEQRAILGKFADPSILTEIEDIEADVLRLKRELGVSEAQAEPARQTEPDLAKTLGDIEASLDELKTLVEEWQAAAREDVRHILEAVQQGRIEQGEIAETVKSLRHWARSVQERGLPIDPELRAAVLKMQQPVEGTEGMYNYLHLSLPFVPGLLSIESEIDLKKLWEEIKARLGYAISEEQDE